MSNIPNQMDRRGGEDLPDPEDRSLAEELGLPDACAPDDAAPVVDYHYLRLYVRRQLTPDAAAAVADLIALFHPWRKALGKILNEEAARGA